MSATETPIEKAQRIVRERREAGTLSSPERNWVRRAALADTKSLRLAINAACFQCLGGTMEDMPDPGWREEIRDCTVISCALHSVRP
jgi:hypothetical protein